MPKAGRALATVLLCVPLWSTDLRAQTAPAAPRADPLVVSAETTRPHPRGAGFLVTVSPDPVAEAAAVISTGSDPADAMANRLYRAGKAVGLSQVLYDNRDRGHSLLPIERFPQLRATRYAAPFDPRSDARGLAGKFWFDTPVIGNASLALTKGPFARSLPRLALQTQASAQLAHALYANNQLYVHPEHADHDRKTGDRFAAQTPYMVISQGSSGSDRPFLHALALTYGSFQPATFDKLRAEGLMAATAQMILRRTLRGVRSDAQYLSPVAHPTVFNAEELRPTAMVSLANALRPDQIPPMVQLEVIEDLGGRPGLEYLAVNLSEKIFTTPGAIARAWRAFEGQRRMTVSAAGTKDPNGHPLQFSWVVVRGDPGKVQITPSGDGGATAEIAIDWHRADEMAGPNGIAASRVEIAVIAHNGFHHSAPAFISLALPVHQTREYAGEGAEARLWRLSYASTEIYADPLIWPSAPWQDRLAHTPDGQVAVITRRTEGAPRPFALHRNADGTWSQRNSNGAQGAARILHQAVGPPASPLTLEQAEIE